MIRQYQQYNEQFLPFLAAAASPFHAVQEMTRHLEKRGFRRLFEQQGWQTEAGGAYYVVRDDAAIIAFTIGDQEQLADGFRVVGAHTDSPCLQIKPAMEQKGTAGKLKRLAVEIYGGALLSTWFDRDLSIAGRVFVQQHNSARPKTCLLNFGRPILSIPSLAIHLNREANDGAKIDKQNQIAPLFTQNEKKEFAALLAEQLYREYPDCNKEAVITDFDLFCHDTNPPALTGAEREFISAGRLDNLLSCFAGLQAISGDKRQKNTLLFCANHEENGSLSTSGADGNFLPAVLRRLFADEQTFFRAMANSFCISLDSAHASHPNHPEKGDVSHEILLNHGPVIKFNANQRYATNGLTAAIFSAICRGAGLPVQKFVMRNDMPCGSTIGPMTAARLGINTVDVGAATLAMHSIREFTGAVDPWLCYRALYEFYTGNYHQQQTLL